MAVRTSSQEQTSEAQMEVNQTATNSQVDRQGVAPTPPPPPNCWFAGLSIANFEVSEDHVSYGD